MTLSDVSVNRPVFATVMSLVIVILGLIAYNQLPVREYPDIDPPVVTVTTVYPGANSGVIESEITDILEEEFSGVEGIRTMTSTSRDQVSTVIVEFILERDVDIAAQDLRDKISRIRSRLPDDIDEPIIAKADSNSQPIMWVKVRSDERDLIELGEYMRRNIKDYFQNIPGVSKVIIGGERKKSIQILVDPKKLAARDLTILDIDTALRDNNIELPAGRVLSLNKEFSVNVDAKLKTVKGYENLIVKSSLGATNNVRLKDIAQVFVGAENDRSFVRFNGQQGAGMGIVRQQQANTVEISKAANKLIKELNEKVADDIIIEPSYDAATFIKLSIQEVYQTILIASLLVILIIFVFLRNFRSTIIPAMSIPVSLIGVMAPLLAMGFTINLITLLALVIAVGIVVDDSIIVLENIYHYIEKGMDPKEAARKGAREITLAVIATTLVLISIFIPVTFISGVTGKLLGEFAFALSFATVISSFVALTLTPMLCSKVLKPNLGQTSSIGIKDFFIKLFSSIFTSLENAYEKVLASLVKFSQLLVFFTIVSCIALSVFLFKSIPVDFIPDEDRGSFLTIVQAPVGSTIDYLDTQIRKAENLFQTMPDVHTSISVAAFGRDAPGKVTEGIIITRLKDWSERQKSVFGIVGPLFPVLTSIPEAFVLPIFPKSGPDSGFGSQPIQLVIKSNDLDFLVKASAEMTKRASSLPKILFAKSNLFLNKPEVSIDIDRNKALQLDVDMNDISRTLDVLFNDNDITDFNEDGENYNVIVQVPRHDKNKPKKLEEVFVKSSPKNGSQGEGSLIPLSNLVTVRETITAEELSHHNRKKSFTIDASPKPGFTPVEGLEQIEELARTVIQELEEQGITAQDIEIDYLGTTKEQKDSASAVAFGFVVALLFAYLFLAAQFESFISPFVIMLTVPLAVVGALIGLYMLQLVPMITQFLINELGFPFFIQFIIPQFKNISINLYSQIGIIMLIAMASKNGILLVEFMNQLREEGMSTYEAIVTASKRRLRPILMTAFSTVLGIMPIAIALGVGTQSRQAMGVAVVSGMIFATFLTLFVVPCAYRLINRD